MVAMNQLFQFYKKTKMKYNLNFNRLPQGNPIIEGNGKNEQFISIFIEKWNTPYKVEVLLEYLNMIDLEMKDHEDYNDILENGIYDDVHSNIFFKDKKVQVQFNNEMSDEIELHDFIDIVNNWKIFINNMNQNN